MADRGTSTTPEVKWADPINLAQIARMVGVLRATVVTWRRRHPDFPDPVGGTETSPLFALAQVQAWLTEHGLPGGRHPQQAGRERSAT